jgi:hypothetical protein
MMEDGGELGPTITEKNGALPNIPGADDLKLDGWSQDTDVNNLALVTPSPIHGHVQGGRTDSTGKRVIKQPSDSDPRKFMRSFLRNPMANYENRFERRGTLMTEEVNRELEKIAPVLIQMKKKML